MANRRMLSRNVSANEQLADCSLLARLLYTWGLPHASDWGVLQASPRRLKAEVFPLSDDTAAQVAAAIDELVNAGLWERFVADGSDYVFYPTFDKYQDIRFRRENSRDGLPLPPGAKTTSPRESRRNTGSHSESRRISENHGESRDSRGEVEVDVDSEERLVESPPTPSLASSAQIGPQHQPQGESDLSAIAGATANTPERPDHHALVLAIEGAYPTAKERKRNAHLTVFLEWLGQPGCPYTEAQLVEKLESDLPQGPPESYIRHLLGSARASPARAAPVVTASDSAARPPSVEDVLRDQGAGEEALLETPDVVKQYLGRAEARRGGEPERIGA